MPGFLMQFGAQAAEVLGRGGGFVGFAGGPFASAFFMVESMGHGLVEASAVKRIGNIRERRSLPFAILLLPALNVSKEVSEGSWNMRFSEVRSENRTRFEAGEWVSSTSKSAG